MSDDTYQFSAQIERRIREIKNRLQASQKNQILSLNAELRGLKSLLYFIELQKIASRPDCEGAGFRDDADDQARKKQKNLLS